MVTFKDVIEDLQEIGRVDIIEVLGRMYDDRFERVKSYTDRDTEFLRSSDWIDGAMSWYNAHQKYGVNMTQVHTQLKAMDRREEW